MLGSSAPQVELHRGAIVHGAVQQAMQVGPVEGGVGRAVARNHLGAQGQGGQRVPVVGAAHL